MTRILWILVSFAGSCSLIYGKIVSYLYNIVQFLQYKLYYSVWFFINLFSPLPLKVFSLAVLWVKAVAFTCGSFLSPER